LEECEHEFENAIVHKGIDVWSGFRVNA